jgi:hypothetical protein
VAITTKSSKVGGPSIASTKAVKGGIRTAKW